MIPEEIETFLRERATVAVCATRNAKCLPEIHCVSGWLVMEDHETVACSIPSGFTTGLIDSLDDNGQFTMTVEQIESHVTYQLKGDYVGSHAPSEVDIQAHESARQRFATVVNELFGLPADLCAAYIPPPEIAVRFKVREIFLQTPGPRAGRRLVPVEEEQ